MRFVNFYRKPISIFVMVTFTILLCFWAKPLPAATTVPTSEKKLPAALEKGESGSNGVIEQGKPQPVIKKGKKFPWLLVGLGTVVVGVAIYFLVIKKSKCTLTINLGTGTAGSPAVTAEYKKGAVVNYNYTAQAGYGSLLVRLDGVAVAASGTVKMDKDHTLDVSATQQYTLRINLGTGTTGKPSATASYNKNQVVSYNYTPQAGYGSLLVKLDGLVVPKNGTVKMDKDHTINASAVQQYTLTVNLGTGTTGKPSATASYDKDQVVNYSYTTQAGYGSLLVKLDGLVVPKNGTVKMGKDRTLDVSATQQYTLTVNLGTGATGTPSATASYDKGQVVNYSYNAQFGYSNMQVKLDGVAVAASGTVAMNTNHTLFVSAIIIHAFGGTIPIFGFHGVMPSSGAEGEISTGQLNELCSLLKQKGYQTISFQDLFAWVNGGKALPPKPVILTTDDGYQSVYQYAFPIIQSYGYKMTLFVSTDYIGSSDGDRKTNSFDAGTGNPVRKMLVWPEIAIMASAGCEIQSHGTSHRNLGSMSYDQVLIELQNSKAIIQRSVGGNCNVVAWPYGTFSGESIRALYAAGYVAGVAFSGGSLNTAAINWVAIPRIRFLADTSISSLAGYLP